LKSINAVLWVEVLKVRKSTMFWGTILFFMFVSTMMGLMLFVQLHPEIASKLGMIGDKASMLRFGEPNWQNYFKLLMMGISAIGLVGNGFVASWVFGREYTDHTVKDLLVLPVSRSSIVFSKMIVIVLWSLILSFVYLMMGILVGLFIDIPAWSADIAWSAFHTYAVTSFLILFLCTPLAFLACYSRGFLLPLGFVILTLIVANFTGLVGLGPYFPWAIPGLYATSSGTAAMPLHLVSYIILLATGLLGLLGTLAIWRLADQK